MGNDKAKNCLGYMYEMGWGVEKDYEKAFAYYTQAMRGSFFARLNVAYLLKLGLGTPMDLERARQLYTSVSLWGRESWLKGRGLTEKLF